MDTVSLNNLLRQMPVFGGLNDESLSFIVERSDVDKFSSGEYFFRQGDSANEFYVIKSGTVAVERDWNGHAVELNRFGVGDCFGEMAIVDLEPRSASVHAIDNCEVLMISRKNLAGLYKNDLEQYAMIMMNMGREISRRLRIADQRLFEIDRQTLK